jgi:hypothetical protein
MLVQVSGPTFCAGLVLEDNRVVEAAPILRFTLGWHRHKLVTYFRRRGYRIKPVW